MLVEEKIKEVNILATQIRIETVKMLGHLGFGHLAGALSLADTIAVLYGLEMKYDPQNPQWDQRDWLVSSKGHAGPAIYAALAIKGFFPLEQLLTINTPGTHLPSHCDRNLTLGIDMTTGSLGQGASTAIGVAEGHRYQKKENWTYLILGDGECQEGQVWEAASYAGGHKLDQLIAFVDNNKQQLDGFTDDVHPMFDIRAKFESFGWHAVDVKGNDVQAIHEAVQKAKLKKGQPSMIVLDTVKGEGASFVAGKEQNHHVTISKEEMTQALEELHAKLEEVSR
jgi:transketolase